MTTETQNPPSPQVAEHITLPLSALFLDPNNHRFADRRGEVMAGASSPSDPRVQQRVLQILLGDKREGVADLLDSFRAHGWLDGDVVLVRTAGPGQFIVLDGNRRIAALLQLRREHEERGFGLAHLDPGIFAAVPVIRCDDGDALRDLVRAGLQHIGGRRGWSLYNQALLVRELRFAGATADDIVGVGVSPREYNLSMRALRLMEQYGDSPWRDHQSPALFPLLREVAATPALALNWLGWDDTNPARFNDANLLRLFAWLSPGDGADGEPTDPVITRREDIRALAELIDDPRALEALDRTRSLTRARDRARIGQSLTQQAERALDECGEQLDRLFSLATRLSDRQRDQLRGLGAKLRAVEAATNARHPEIRESAESTLRPFNELRAGHFRALHLEHYRGLRDLRVEALRAVNVFAGINNCGKTSLLESVHLLAGQHDPDAMLSLVRVRARVQGVVDPRWFVDQIPPRGTLRGAFDGDDRPTVVSWTVEPRDDVEEQAYYLGTLRAEASYVGRTQHAATHFYENRDRSTSLDGGHVLCRSVLLSPFTQHDPSLLARANAAAVERRSKERIVAFLRENFAPDLRGIEMVDRFQRFLVTRGDEDRPLDLSQYGDGMQRIFLTALLVAQAEHGVLLVDEFENGVHAGLLAPFARFVAALAREFEVQLFVTTHSAEAVQAFTDAQLGDDLATYALVRGGEAVQAKRYDGPQLRELMDFAGFDLRRVR